MKRTKTTTTLANLNVTALRVLSVLKHLIHLGPMHTAQLNECLASNPAIQRGFGTETLTKYVNTLRHLGCCIPRATPGNQFRYELTLSPFPHSLSPETALLLTRVVSKAIANPQCSEDSVSAWQKILWSVTCPSSQALMDIKLLLNTLDTQPPPPSSLSQTTRPDTWQHFCQQGQAVVVKLRPGGTNTAPTETLTLDPVNVVSQPWGQFYVGVDRNTGQERLLHPDHISDMRQLPTRVLGRTQTRRVQFRLFNKLARSYRLYPGEHILPSHPGAPKNTIDVLSTQCELPVLLQRLLKYGHHCQVLSPESAVESMKAHLTHQLAVINQQALPGSSSSPVA